MDIVRRRNRKRRNAMDQKNSITAIEWLKYG
jgi:hypothetical protein